MEFFSSSSFLPFLSLCVACLISASVIQDDASDIPCTVLDKVKVNINASTSDAHLALKEYCIKERLGKLFVRNFFVNRENLGPYYTCLNPKIENNDARRQREAEFIVDELDFGTMPEYIGVQKEMRHQVEAMKAKLLKFHMFPTIVNVLVKKVIVNGIEYGHFKIPTHLEEHF